MFISFSLARRVAVSLSISLRVRVCAVQLVDDDDDKCTQIFLRCVCSYLYNIPVCMCV